MCRIVLKEICEGHSPNKNKTSQHKNNENIPSNCQWIHAFILV